MCKFFHKLITGGINMDTKKDVLSTENFVALRKKFEKKPIQHDFANDRSIDSFPDTITDEEIDEHIKRMSTKFKE